MQHDIRQWAAEQTGHTCPILHATHVEAIAKLLEETGTTLDAWTLAAKPDPRWSSRAPRTELERRAVYVGQSYAPRAVGLRSRRGRRCYFMVPATDPVD
jgi:hypothetical protein